MEKEKLEKSFTYQAPKENQIDKYQALRQKAKELSLLINDLCPEGREKSLSITKLEETIMWANKSIAINE